MLLQYIESFLLWLIRYNNIRCKEKMVLLLFTPYLYIALQANSALYLLK